MAASAQLHEPEEKLKPSTIDHHRAVMSLVEELEAIDWYDQRFEASSDDDLRAILAHNRDEEKEHAAMILEWLRRRDPALAEVLRTYIGREGPIVHAELAADRPTDVRLDGSLGIGSLRGRSDALPSP